MRIEDLVQPDKITSKYQNDLGKMSRDIKEEEENDLQLGRERVRRYAELSKSITLKKMLIDELTLADIHLFDLWLADKLTMDVLENNQEALAFLDPARKAKNLNAWIASGQEPHGLTPEDREMYLRLKAKKITPEDIEKEIREKKHLEDAVKPSVSMIKFLKYALERGVAPIRVPE